MNSFSLLALAFGVPFFLSCASQPTQVTQVDPLETIESTVGGRLGLVAIDLRTGEKLERRADERFLMCSTFKLLLAAHVLKRVDERAEKLSRIIPYSEKDLLEYAPVTRANLNKKGLSIEKLAAAAVETSDNTAANLLLGTQGGPVGLTKFLKSVGDETTHLDRFEPELNQEVLGRDLDSTTPRAMAQTLQALLLDRTLSASSRDRLKGWLLANTTSNKRFRAGLPIGWRVADKTGTSGNRNVNDIGIIYTPDNSPIVIAAFVSNSEKSVREIEAALSDIARLIASRWGPSPKVN